MKTLVFVLVLVAAGIVGLGFYLGWFHIGSGNTDGKSDVTLSVDKEKFEKDKNAAEEKVHDVVKKSKDKSTSSAVSSHDGKAVDITGAKLVMTNMEGAEESTYTLTADVKVTCDGKVCKAADLKSGMRIRVTTEDAEPHAATRIEALDTHRDFEKGA
jgi:GH24 family phage-related lysozyme (muramidase)